MIEKLKFRPARENLVSNICVVGDRGGERLAGKWAHVAIHVFEIHRVNATISILFGLGSCPITNR